MNTLLVLQNRAVKAAQEERWIDAQACNKDILKIDSENISALNRLGFAYMQNAQYEEAKKTYEKVLKIDFTNSVANKYLEVIEKAKTQPIKLPKALKHSDFIDEPGKTKSVTLVRLADAEVIEELSVGADCELKCTKSRISVQCEDKYIGTLPDDLFIRLQPLMEAGNTYICKIQSLKQGGVRIFIRETFRAKSVTHIPSFPTEALSVLSLDHAEIAREDELPVVVSETGEDGDGNILETRDIDEALEEDYEDDEETEVVDTDDEEI